MLYEKVWEVRAWALVSAMKQVPSQSKTPEAMQMQMTVPGKWDAKRDEVNTMDIQLPSKWEIWKGFNSGAIWTRHKDGICGLGGRGDVILPMRRQEHHWVSPREGWPNMELCSPRASLMSASKTGRLLLAPLIWGLQHQVNAWGGKFSTYGQGLPLTIGLAWKDTQGCFQRRSITGISLSRWKEILIKSICFALPFKKTNFWAVNSDISPSEFLWQIGVFGGILSCGGKKIP